MIRTTNDVVRSLLFQASLPARYWAEALATATYLLNRLPTKAVAHPTPYFALFGIHPSYDHLCVLGCACYPNLASTAPHKLAPRSTRCVFLGYSPDHKGYRCLDLTSHRVLISRHVVFDESDFPFSSTPTASLTELDVFFDPDPVSPIRTGSSTSPPSAALPAPPTPALPRAASAPSALLSPAQPRAASASPMSPRPAPTQPSVAPTPSAPPHTAPSCRYTDPIQTYQRHGRRGTPARSHAEAPTYYPVVVHRDPRHIHPMVTRRAAGVLRPPDRLILSATYSSALPPVPTTVRGALADPQWRRAMEAEYEALQANHTWDLVPSPPGANVVTGKWIFKLKLHADGSLERYKACYVLWGFTQRPEVDYDETFSPVVKPATIRTVLTPALSRDWPVHQLDVTNAFLHGTLTETVYCTQPVGFVDPAHPDLVCKLNKSLYGLKQAPGLGTVASPLSCVRGGSSRPNRTRPCSSFVVV
jgi:hypothetical protein